MNNCVKTSQFPDGVTAQGCDIASVFVRGLSPPHTAHGTLAAPLCRCRCPFPPPPRHARRVCRICGGPLAMRALSPEPPPPCRALGELSDTFIPPIDALHRCTCNKSSPARAARRPAHAAAASPAPVTPARLTAASSSSPFGTTAVRRRVATSAASAPSSPPSHIGQRTQRTSRIRARDTIPRASARGIVSLVSGFGGVVRMVSHSYGRGLPM